MPEKITLTGVPETMLQTVYARARESAGRGAIRDETAEGGIPARSSSIWPAASIPAATG